MILVGQYDSPFVRRIAFALHWYRLPFERNTMSVFGDAEQMRTINPLGRIPSLILDDGETLIDSWAIHDYLDDVAGLDRRLTPEQGPERRKVLRTTAMAAGAVDKAGAIVYERALRPKEIRFEPWIGRCSAQLNTALDHLNREAADEWLSNGPITQANVMLGALTWYVLTRVPEVRLAERYVGLLRHYERMQSLPEFRMTAPSDGEAMPPPM